MKRIDANELIVRTSLKTNEMAKRLERYDSTMGRVITSQSTTFFTLGNCLTFGFVSAIVLAAVLYLAKPSIVMDSEFNSQTHFKVLSLNTYKVVSFSIGFGILLTLVLVSMSKLKTNGRN